MSDILVERFSKINILQQREAFKIENKKKCVSHTKPKVLKISHFFLFLFCRLPYNTFIYIFIIPMVVLLSMPKAVLG